MAKSVAVVGFGANGLRRSREALLRKALFASTALVGVTLAHSAAAQEMVNPTGGGTITAPTNISSTPIADSTGSGGGIQVTNVDTNSGNPDAVIIKGVNYTNTTGASGGPTADGFYARPYGSGSTRPFFGDSTLLPSAQGSVHIATTVAGGAAVDVASGTNEGVQFYANGMFGGDQGFIVSAPGGFINFQLNNNATETVTGTGAAGSTGVNLAAGGGSTLNGVSGVLNISGYATGVNATSAAGATVNTSGGGSISATTTGILASAGTGTGAISVTSGSAIAVSGSSGTGISATTNGGAISITTVAGGTISGGAYGITATGGPATISLASAVSGSTNSLLLGSSGNSVTLNAGATLTGTADLGGGTNTLTLTGAGTTDTLAADTVLNATSLTKSGTGTWTLTGAPGSGDFTGGTAIGGGTLALGNATTLPGGGGTADPGYDSAVLLSGTGASLSLTSTTAAVQGGTYIGIRVTGANDTVSNLGSITNAGTNGNDQVGAAIADYATSGTLTINNGSTTNATALLEGNNNGINQRGSSTSAITLNNYGTVKGDVYSAIENSGSAKLLTVNNFATGVIYANKSGNGINSGASGGTSGGTNVTNAGKIVGINDGIYSAQNGNVVNTGTIASGSYDTGSGAITVGGTAGVYLVSGGTITNGAVAGTAMANAASVIEGGRGVYSTNALMLTNYGMISGSSASFAGVDTSGFGGVITNYGTVQGGAQAVVLNNGGTVYNFGNDSSLAATGTSNLTDASGVYSNGALTLINQGMISTAHSGTAYGVEVIGVGTITNSGAISANSAVAGVSTTGVDSMIMNQTGGTITGGTYGARFLAAGSVINSGTITGSTNNGVLATGALSVTNTGTITGATIGVSASGGALTLDSSGTITGSGGTAVSDTDAYDNTVILRAGSITNGGVTLGSGNDNLTLYNGQGTANGGTKAAASLTGAVDLGTGTNTLTLAGAGTYDGVTGANTTGARGTLAANTVMNATKLVKQDGGTWTMTGTAGPGDFNDSGSGGSFVPGVQIMGGRLIESNTGAALGTGTVNIGSGATLELANPNASNVNSSINIGSITFTGTGTLVKSGTGNTGFGNNGTVNFNLSQGALIDILGGSIEASASYQGNWTNNQSDLEVDTGAIFRTSEAVVRVDRLTGVGNLQIDGTGSLTVGVGGIATTMATFDGTITNQNSAGPLTKIGSGTQTLTGANTYTGATTISGGTLALSGAGTIATSASLADNATFDISGLTNGGTTVKTLTGSGVVKLGANLLTLATPGTIAVSISDGGIVPNTGGKVTLSGAGTYVLTGASTYTGATTINSGATLQATTSSLSGNSAIVDNGTLAFVQGGVGGTYAPGISGSGGVAVSGTGTGTLTFSGAVTDSLGVLISDGSNVAITSTGSISASTGTTASAIYGSGANFTVSNAGTISAPGNQGATYGSNGIYATNGGVVNNTGNIFGIPQGSTATYRSDGVITFGTGIVNNTGATYSSGTLTGNTAGGGVITGGWDGAYVTANGAVYNSGTIAGGTYQGVAIQGVGTLNNYAGGRIVGVSSGVEIDGAATVVNNGLIEVGTYNSTTGAVTVGTSGYGVYVTAGGSVANGALANTAAQNTASQIVGGSQAGIYSNAALMLTNYGAISSNGTGTVDAVTIQGTATVTNTGTITAATGGASGIAFVGIGSSITNSGTITGGNNATYGYALQAAGGAAGSITNQSGGTLTASTGGILRASTGAVTITNSGVISGTGATSDGINATAGTGTITNNTGGFVVGVTDGIDAAGSASVSNAGTIGTGMLSGNTLTTAGVYGLKLAGATNAVTNTGTISTGAAGIFATTGTLALTNTGTISSGNTYGGNTQDAVYVNGTSTVLNAGLITNATRTGTIAAPTYSAIALIGASTVTNASAGVLTGGTDATFGEAIQFHAASTFNNYGLATGTGKGAVYQTSNAATVVNLFAGSTTGNITLQGGNDTVSLYTGTTNATAIMQGYTDAVSGAAGSVVLQAAGTLQQATIGTIALGGGTNALNLMGVGTGTLGGSVNLANVTGATTLNKTGTGTWTLTGADASAAATINAGNGTPSGLLIFSGSGAAGAVYVNGATIRATTAAGFGTGTVYEQDPTTQFAYNGTNANTFVLASTAPTTDPTVFQTYGTGITATLTGTITETNAPQPLTFSSIDTNNVANSGTFVLANTGDAWTGTTTIAGGAGYATTLQGTTATISGGAILDNGVLDYNQTTAGSVGVAISGGGSLVKDGTGTVTLTQHDSYTGGTTVLAGTLVAATVNGSYVADALGSGTVAIAAGATVQYANPYTAQTPGPSGAQIYIAANSFTGGGTLSFTGDPTSLTVIDDVSGQADVAMAATGLINVQSGSVLARGTNVFAGNQAGLTIASGASFDGGSGAAITVDALNGAGTYIGNGALTVGMAGGTGSFAGTIGDESGGVTTLTKTGAGTETLSGINSYSGATSITGGTLALSGNGSIANSSVAVSTGTTFDVSALTDGGTSIVSLTGAGTTALGANTLTLTNAGGTYGGTITGTGGLTVAAGTFTYGADNILDDRATLTVDSGATVDLAGHSDTVATLDLYGTLANGGLLTATTYNAFAGSTIGQSIASGTLNVYGNTSLTAATAATPVNIYAGTLTTTSAELLSDTGAVNIASGGTLVLGGTETIGSLGDLAYNGTTNGGTVQLGQYTLSVGGANTSTGFSGIVTGTGGLTKTGTGTLILSGANNYTGTTTVSGGTLQGSTTSIAGSTIVDNATLAYNQASSGTVAQTIIGSGIVTVTGLAAGNALTVAGMNGPAGGFAVTDASMVAFTGTDGGAATEVTLQGAGTLINTGTITGTTTGVAATGANGTATVVNASTGTIAGASYGVQSSGAGALMLTNYGTITGPVSALSTGANVLSLRAGSNTGAVTTGGGNDTLALYTGFVATNPVVDATTGLTLRQAGTYAAATVGAIDLGAGANILNLRGMGDGSVANGATGSIDLSSVANAGTITKQDAGTWTLSGAATDAVTSAATINAGIGGTPGSGGLLIFSGSGLTGTINVNGAVIRATAAGAFGTGTINAIDPTIQYAASGTYANPIALQSANPATDPTTLQTFGAGITATLTGAITQTNVPQPLVFSSINTDGSQGTGTFVLTNASNAWTGVTTVNAGTTLRGTTATLSGASFTNNGVLDFNQGTAGTSARAIAGSGTVLIDGNGTVTLTGAITATGGVQIGANTTATLSNVSDANTAANSNTVTFVGTGATLNVANGGSVTGTNGNAVFSNQANNTINNAGTIAGNATYTAVFLNATTGTNGVTNAAGATIRGYNAISSASTLNLTNNGTLTGQTGNAVFAGGAGTSVINDGTIMGISTGTSVSAAVGLNASGTITNNAGATISGNRGIAAGGTTGGTTVNNYGQITGIIDNAVSLFSGGNVTNYAGGTITATHSGGWGVYTAGAGTIDNQGMINANSGIVSTSNATVITNEGTIAAAVNGVWGSAASITLTNTGTITGGADGVRAEAAGSSITNAGTIEAAANSGGQGVYMTGGTLTNQAGGTIGGDGAGAAIYLTGTGNTVAINGGSTVNGLIDASSTTDATGVYTIAGTLNGGFTGGTGNDTLTLITGATVSGTLDGGAGTDTLVLDGSTNGALNSAQVVNFENGAKNGTGTWTLTGTTAASPTAFAINAGTLAVAGGNALADNSAITIASGATLQLNNSETIGSLAGAGNVTLGANTLTTGGLNASPTFSGVASGTGGLTKVGTGTLTLSGLNTYTGATTISAGTLALGATNALAAGSAVTVASGATLNVATYNDIVASLALAGTLAGTGTLTAATYTLNGATVNANLGAGTLTQASGTSMLNGSSAAGTVAINGGTLATGGAERIADNAAVTIASGAQLSLGGAETIGSLSGAGNVALGANTLTTGGLNANPTFSGAIAGSGGLTKVGTGTLTLSGINTYTGATTINGGTLAVSGGMAIADASAVTIAATGTLQLNASETIGSLAGAGNVVLGANTLTTGGLNASPTFSGVASGTGGLTKIGTGTLTLSGANTYTGVTTISAGTLALGATNAIGMGSVVMVATGATLNLAAFNDTVASVVLNGTLAGTGTLTAATYMLNGAAVNANLGAGTLNQAGGTSVLSGTSGTATVNVNAGTLALGASDRLADNATVMIASGAILDLGANSDTVGLVGIAGTLNGTGTLTAAEYDLAGATVNGNLGAGNLFQQAATSTLNGTSGAANVMVTGGTLTLGASNRLADNAAVGVATGATLNMGANTDTVGTLALNGTLAGTGTLTATTYTLNGAAVNANLGTGTLVQAGGTSVLTGAAATNMVAVMAGTLRLGASERIADAAMLGVASGATFDLASYNETVGTLAGSGTLVLGLGTLTSGGTNAAYAFSGSVTGAGDLTKVGTGTFSLVGNEALTGRLNVNAGTLMLAGATAGSVRVQGGTLTGASTIAGNLLLSSGTLSPGIATQPVAMIQAGSLTVTGGTTVFDFGGMASGFTADLLKVTGAATLTGGTVTTRALDSSAAYKMEQTYTVLQAGTLTGTYASGSTFTQVSNDSDLYYRLRYDLVPNGVVLEVRKTVDFTTTLGTGATGNELAVASALNGGLLTGSDAFATALNAISQLTPDQRRATLDNIGGESIADISTSVALVGNRFNELLRQRVAVGGAGNSADPSLIAGIAGGKRGLDQVRASGQVGAEGSSFAEGSKDNHAGAWVQTFGGAGQLDGLGGTASIEDQSYGVAAGIDAKVAGLSIGGAFAASALDTRVEGRNATNRGTLYQGGGYVAYDNGQAYASAVGSYFSGDVTSARQVYIGGAFQGTATAAPKVTGYTAGGAAGYRLPVGGGVRFTPQVSFEATHVDRDAFTETGAGVLSLSAGKDVRNLYTATVEGRLSHVSAAPGGIVEPYAGAGVAFNFGDLNTVSANQFTGAPTGTGAFAITGARLSPTTALINGGIEAHPNDRVTLGMGVETRLSNRERDGRLELHVRLGF